MKQGLITKGVGGFYDVLVNEELIRCRARGIFRKDNITPMVGDRVKVSMEDKSIVEILPRKNQLLRPVVANIDLLGVVIAPSHPAPDFYLADRLIVNAENNGIQVFIIINKIDLGEDGIIDEIIHTYAPTQYPIIALSCKKQSGFDDLHKLIKGKIITFAGQSGVGKSSIINVLSPGENLEIGDLSLRISRGKHTTRHTSLLTLPSGGMLVDTPGFSTMNMDELMPENLQYMYPDFSDYIGKCRFKGCIHDQEPGCKVKEMVSNDLLSGDRYKRYIKLLNELREIRRNIW
ncbi:MAG TPA: ribosome small subunit-dependent GTPase A [Clostridia bacterium]|nr:ribosome small subunit-dependent GTPase A [Clostridia bacterium]